MVAKPLDLGLERLGRRRNDRVVERLGTRLGDPVIGQNDQPWPPCRATARSSSPRTPSRPNVLARNSRLLGMPRNNFVDFTIRVLWNHRFLPTAYCLLRHCATSPATLDA